MMRLVGVLGMEKYWILPLIKRVYKYASLLFFLAVILAPSPWRWIALVLLLGPLCYEGVKLGVFYARAYGILPDQKKPREGP